MWTLPAPTLGKLDLLRQSWRLNKVLDDAAELRSKIKAADLEKANLEQALVSEKARSLAPPTVPPNPPKRSCPTNRPQVAAISLRRKGWKGQKGQKRSLASVA